MKQRLLSLILCMVMVLSLATPAFAADTPSTTKYPINATYFPDDEFRTYVQNNLSEDGAYLPARVADSVTSINLADAGCHPTTLLRGLQLFPNLKTLILDSQVSSLQAIDLTGNTKLTTLELCNQKKLTSLDLSKNTALVEADVHGNTLLGTLKLPGTSSAPNTTLTTLDCSHCFLTALDVRYQNELWELYCTDNALSGTGLRLPSSNTSLFKMDCSDNQLTGLDVSGLGKLQFLWCYDNDLSSLDITNTKVLTVDTANTIAALGNQKNNKSISVKMTDTQQRNYFARFSFLTSNARVHVDNASGISYHPYAAGEGVASYEYEGTTFYDIYGTDPRDGTDPYDFFRQALLSTPPGCDKRLGQYWVEVGSILCTGLRSSANIAGTNTYPGENRLPTDGQLIQSDSVKNAVKTALEVLDKDTCGEDVSGEVSFDSIADLLPDTSGVVYYSIDTDEELLNRKAAEAWPGDKTDCGGSFITVFYDLEMSYLDLPEIYTNLGNSSEISFSEANKKAIANAFKLSNNTDKRFISGVKNDSRSNVNASQSLTSSATVSTTNTTTSSKTERYVKEEYEESNLLNLLKNPDKIRKACSSWYGASMLALGMLFDFDGMDFIDDVDKAKEEGGFKLSDKTFTTSETVSQTNSETNSRTTSVSVSLPPMTQSVMLQSTGTSTFTIDYDYPVAITYKVMIIPVSFVVHRGMIDSKAHCDFGIVGTPYIFGGTSSADAASDLYNRCTKANIPGYENTNCNGGQKMSAQRAGTLNDYLGYAPILAGMRPVSVTGGSIRYNAESVNTEVYDAVPLYPLRYVNLTGSAESFNLSGDSKLNLSGLGLEGLNQYSVAYHSFDPRRGKWIICNESGEPTTDSVAKIEKNATNGNYYAYATGNGKAYAKYVINEDCYVTSSNMERCTTNADLSATAMVELNCSNNSDISKAAVTLSATSYTYSGTAKKPAVTVNDGTKTLVKDTDYTVKYSNNTNVGTASVTVTGIGSYTGSVSKTFTIKPKDLSALTVTLSAASYTYSGTSKKPTVSITNGDLALVKDTDYTVKYSNNKNAGTASVTVTGIGNYTGSVSKTFTIKPKGLSALTATLSATSYTYSGTSKKPTVSITNGDLALVKDTDFTVKYSNNKNAGTASVTITGIGNYTGSVSKTFTINPRSLSALTATLSATSYTYSGTSKKPTVSISYGDLALVKDTDFTVKYSNNKNAGTASVTVTGIGNYKSSKTLTFTINPKSISGFDVALSCTKYTYSGTAKKPVVTLTNGSTTLVKTTDFTVAYTKNTSIGTATVTITGTGNYKSSIKKTFKIVPKTPANLTLTNPKAGQLKATWSAVSGNVTGYQIQYGLKSDFSGATATTTTNLYKTVSSLTKGKKYYVRVRAYKTVDGTKYYSSYSDKVSITLTK